MNGRFATVLITLIDCFLVASVYFDGAVFVYFPRGEVLSNGKQLGFNKEIIYNRTQEQHIHGSFTVAVSFSTVRVAGNR